MVGVVAVSLVVSVLDGDTVIEGIFCVNFVGDTEMLGVNVST